MKFQSLQDIQTLPNSCVYGFINDSTKEYYISYSQNLKSRIGAIIDSVDVVKDGVRLEVFCLLDNKEYKMLIAEVYKCKYVSLGYRNLGAAEYINYNAKVQYSWDLKLVYVVISNKRKDKKIVGVFKTIQEADEFYLQYYVGKEVVLPVYAVNELTREYCSI